MGQATVDLPAIPDQSPAPVTSADDLLSQLAGQEIDRMLADADGKGEPQTPPEPAPAPAAETASAVAPATDAYQAEVDQLFRQLNAVPLEASKLEPSKPEAPLDPPQTEAPDPAIADASHLPPAEPQELAAPAPAQAAPVLDEPTTPAEAHALAADTPEPDVRAAIDSAIKQVEIERTPILVRILELINAPFAFCPDVLRDVLGKIAILTLMNSVGVLLYLLLFRK